MRTLLFAIALFGLCENAHAFGHKKMNLTEVKGVTETQVVKGTDTAKLSVMVRGKGAELLFRTLKEKRTEEVGSAALELIGNVNNTHWTVHGKQVACSRIQNAKNKKKEDYACAFELDKSGEVAATVEPFSPNLFNLVRTKTQAHLFPKKKGRGLASTVSPHPTSAFAMYDAPKFSRDKVEDTLFVFNGPTATEIMNFLAENKSGTFEFGGANGVKGKEISCVAGRKAGEQDRCALVVSLSDGSVSTRKNPLFR
jgi:hypothetical protein